MMDVASSVSPEGHLTGTLTQIEIQKLAAKRWPWALNPRILLVTVILVVFWDTPWAGAPRADQVVYLHQAGKYTSVIDVLYESPSWNRTHSAGDFVLYRPLLYLFLGLQYALFGYHFWAWQLTGLTVHIATVLLLHSICRRRMGEPWAFLLSALFACSFLGSQLVIWNHLTAYVLFAAL